MEYTSGSLKLAKPQLSDAPDITRMNPNWDKIDENISEFNDKINVLSNNGFNGNYISEVEGLTDMNTFQKTGQFEVVVNLSEVKNLPYNIDGLVRLALKNEKRYSIGSDFYYQEVNFKSTPYDGEKWYRDKTDGQWSQWKQIATTDKTEILLTPPPGFSVADNFSNKCFIDGVGNIHLNFCWKKTDSSDITGLPVANLPASISPTYRTVGYMTQWNNSNDYDYQIGMCYVDNVSNGRLVCHVAKQCKIISGYVCFRRE